MAMKDFEKDDVCILIPTLNEEATIGEVIEGFLRQGYHNILVIDGNSTDRTREIAERMGAKVVIQTGKGKGQAISEAFSIIDSPVVVIVDGDGTYLPEEVNILLEPIRRGYADHVIGNRFANFEEGAFTKLNLIGNKIINFMFRVAYGVELHDILSGYRALTKELYKSVRLEKPGFEVETELTVETIAKGFRIVEVPITYRKRGGKTKLNPFKDGLRIGMAIYDLLKKYSPGRYFYLIGLGMIAAGVGIGLYVVRDWFRHITHYLLADLTALLIITGFQVIIFGTITDLLYRGNVELRKEINSVYREIEELRKEIKDAGLKTENREG